MGLSVIIIFQDSVTQVGFNHDGSLFATGDMGGVIQVWRTATHQKVWDYQLGDLMVRSIIISS